jgi:GNAT superfamily N-acetyltransferase
MSARPYPTVTLERMLDGVRYRPATARDATVVAALVADGFSTYRDFAPRGWTPRTAFQEEPEIHERLDRGDVHARLALADGRLAGFTGWMPAATRRLPREAIPGRAHLWSLFIAPAWWGSGLAAGLLDWSTTGMRESGYRTAQLWTPRAHDRARAFYGREGWTSAGRAEFSPELGLDLVLYERAL